MIKGLKPRSVTLKLPYPPSINSYWKSWRGRIVISKAGREYRKQVVEQLRGFKTFKGSVRMIVLVVLPDHRERDLDNIEKCLFDSLQQAGVFLKDYQIDDKRSIRGHVQKPGWIEIQLTEMRERPEQWSLFD